MKNDPTPITDKEISSLEACNSAYDWAKTCDAIKAARDGQYPCDWWEKVKQSGMMDRILSRWGSDSKIKISAPGF